MMMIVAFVIMVVVMRIGGDHARGGRPEKFGEFRVLLDFRRPTLAADMAIEADDMVALGHHQVEIMAHHQNAAAVALSHRRDQLIHAGLTHEVDRLHRFIEHQELRFAQQGAGQQGALQFATRQALEACLLEVRNAGFVQRLVDLGLRWLQRQRQKSPYIERHIGDQRKALRHIADTQVLLPRDVARGQRPQAQHAAHERGFSRPIGPDDSDDLIRPDVDVHVVEDAPPAHHQRCIVSAQNGVDSFQHHAALAQDAQRPVISTMVLCSLKPWAWAAAFSDAKASGASSSATSAQVSQISKAAGWPSW